MINVQYPFLDLTKALLSLIKNLKPADCDKKTLLKDYKITKLVKYLLALHINNLAQSADAFTLSLDETDTSLDLTFIAENINKLEKVLKNKGDVDIDKTKYSQAWLIQQYIRQALNNQDLIKKEFYFPFLDTLMLRLTTHYQHIKAEDGTAIKIEIVGEAGGVWVIEKTKIGWQKSSTNKIADITVYLDQQIAWLLLSNALYVNEIGQFYQIIGDKSLGSHFLKMRTTPFLTL